MVPFERAMKTGVKSAALRYVFANRFVQLGARCTYFMYQKIAPVLNILCMYKRPWTASPVPMNQQLISPAS